MYFELFLGQLDFKDHLDVIMKSHQFVSVVPFHALIFSPKNTKTKKVKTTESMRHADFCPLHC